MKAIVATIILLSAGLTASGQTAKCEMALEKAPAVRSLRLGMEQNEASRILGKPFERGFDDYTERLSVLMIGGGRSGFEGITFVSLDAFYEKISKIHVNYDVEWKDVGEFVTNFSPKLGLPDKGWEIDKRFGTATMKCEDFDVRLSAPAMGDASLTLIDSRAVRAIEAAKAAAVEAKKKEIKP